MIQYIVWFWNKLKLYIYPIKLTDISDLLLNCEESIQELKNLQKDNFIESNVQLLKNITNINLSETFEPNKVLKIIDKEIDYMNKKVEILGLECNDVIINTNLNTLKTNFNQICYIIELQQILEWQILKPKDELIHKLIKDSEENNISYNDNIFNKLYDYFFFSIKREI